VRHSLFLVLIFMQLSGCSMFMATPQTTGYSRQELIAHYDLQRWMFAGRIAVTSSKDSWTANIAWQHVAEQEHLKLSGPWGQGATTIDLNQHEVVINRGTEEQKSSVEPEIFIQQQLGIAVPLLALRYWVLGLPEPGQNYQDVASGFYQNGWLVEYPLMQVSEYLLPKKVVITHPKVKLKLVIDQWNFNES